MALPVMSGNANISITSISFSPSVVAYGETVRITVKLKNNSDHAITKIVASAGGRVPTTRTTYGALSKSVSILGSTDHDSDKHIPANVSWAKSGIYTLTWDQQIITDTDTVDLSSYHWSDFEGEGLSLDIRDCTKYTSVFNAPYSSCYNINLQGTEDELLPILSWRFNPRIELNDLRRCNVNTEEETRPFLKYDDEGTALVTSIIALLNDPNNAGLDWFPEDYGFGVSVTCTPQPSDWEFDRSVYELTGGYDTNTEIFNGTFDNTIDYTISMEISNGFETTGVITRTIPRAFANVHLSGKETGGVAFGMFSKSTEGHPRFECRYPAFFYGGVDSIAVTKYAEPMYSSGFEAYPGHEPLVTRVGCFVFLDGMIRATASKATSSDVVMATLPEWARPRVRVNQLMQGSGANVWWMEVYPDGTVCAARYRPTNSTTYASIASGAQLPVSAMWIAADAYPTEVQTASDTVTD